MFLVPTEVEKCQSDILKCRSASRCMFFVSIGVLKCQLGVCSFCALALVWWFYGEFQIVDWCVGVFWHSTLFSWCMLMADILFLITLKLSQQLLN